MDKGDPFFQINELFLLVSFDNCIFMFYNMYCFNYLVH